MEPDKSTDYGKVEVLKAMRDDGNGWQTTRYIYSLLHGLDKFDRMGFEPCEKGGELHNLGRDILVELRKRGLVEKGCRGEM